LKQLLSSHQHKSAAFHLDLRLGMLPIIVDRRLFAFHVSLRRFGQAL